MTDAELSAKVTEADGRVFIGFKDPHDSAGVDELGTVLANPASVAAGKAYLLSLGLVFEIEFIDMPSVVTRVSSALVPELRSNALIEYVEPILPMTAHAQITTWNVNRVQAPSAWSYSTGSGAKLLILDSGIDNTHPDLAPAVVQSCESPPGTGIDPPGGTGHGTAVSGVAAAVNNSTQIVGVAYGVALWSSKTTIGSSISHDPAYIACGVQFGRTNGVHAINMSFGGPSAYTNITDQINAAYSEGIVLVASAGNDFGGPVLYPASLGSVIAVSATDINDNLALFSNVGPKIELAAPGAGVTSTKLGGDTATVNGTSFSAPHVAAAAAMLKAYNPSWTPYSIRARLALASTDLAPAGRDGSFGYGLLNIVSAFTVSPPNPPVANITGPSSVRPNATCTWFGSVSGGLAPFRYVWFNQSIQVSTTLEATTSFSQSGNLQFQVYDGIAGWSEKTKSITVSPSAPACLQ